jgi:hypothetical protein
VTENSPQITTKPPQIHHQKTMPNTPFFQKTPTKSTKNHPTIKRGKPLSRWTALPTQAHDGMQVGGSSKCV